MPARGVEPSESQSSARAASRRATSSVQRRARCDTATSQDSTEDSQTLTMSHDTL